MKEGLKNRLLRMFRTAEDRGRITRLSRDVKGFTGFVSRALGLVQYLASIACLVAMLLYVGFEPDALDRSLIMKVVRISQIIFIAYVVNSVIFRPERKYSRTLMRQICNLVVLLTIFPGIWSHCGGTENPLVHFMHGRRFLFLCLGIYSVAEVCYGSMQLLGRRTNPSLILSVSFVIFILLGSFALMLPKCTEGPPLRYIDAFFMAASAVSMTGLSTIDTAQVFTPLGWTVMAVLMQIGALGVLTFTSFFAIFFSGNSSIYSQMLMRDFVYSKSMSALVPVILYILSFTLVIELAGAAAIYLSLPDDFLGSLEQRLLFSGFHSLSAFCNCGFTTLPQGMATPALMNGTPAFFIVMIVLILAGGIGFPNLVNFRDVIGEYLRRIKSRILGREIIRKVHVYDLNTKLVLLFTAIFFVGFAFCFYILEYNHSLAGMPLEKKIIQSLFCSATVRTAGFVTIAPQQWLGVTFLIAAFLMWVGCSSQSMGGGIKINAFVAVLLNFRSIVFGQKGVTAFGRTIALSSVRRSNAVVCFSIFAMIAYSCVLMILEPQLPAGSVAFEVFSALTTVGMSFGVTPELGDISKFVLATAMFLGRVGIISVLCGIVGNRPDISGNLPEDDIIVN